MALRVFAVSLGLLVAATSALAQVPAASVAPVALLPRTVNPPHPWQVAAPIARGPEAYFTNLKDGQTIETPFLVKFGLSGGWGLAPIAKPMGGKSGHHHLLINRDLPLDFKKALPFDDQYIHFGKGQMEKILLLSPGTYTLRMLLADDQHLPHFVYSEAIKITVAKKNSTNPETLVKKGVSLQVDSLLDNESETGEVQEVSTAFRVQMHASGLNVGHQAQQEAGTGHFKLSFFPKSGSAAKAVAEMAFVNGETEVWLLPPAGEYQMRVDFVDNSPATAGKTKAESPLVPIRVLKERG